MMKKSYQRRHLRAPFKESVLFADDGYVFKGRALNISEGGLLLDEVPAIPGSDELAMLISLPQLPYFKNFNLLRMQTHSLDLFGKNVVRVKARMARREEFSKDLSNIFKMKVGLEFTSVRPAELKLIEEYVSVFSSNLIYLQTLIDSFNTDEDTRSRARALGKILGYQEIERIAQLRAHVTHDYKSMVWL
jgi:PilZ domain